MGRLRKLEVAAGYVELLKDVDALRWVDLVRLYSFKKHADEDVAPNASLNSANRTKRLCSPTGNSSS